ncbi:MAG: DUF402 domain-containing protein [Candidatus Dormibacteraceae bacterium]
MAEEKAGVVADYRKWPDAQHYRFTAERLGEDDYGVWLGMRAGTGYRGPRVGTFTTHNVLLVPRDAWWTAKFRPATYEVPVYVDVCTPARWHGNRMTAIDLDLDVLRLGDGEIRVDDEDEFALHQVELRYPGWLIQAAVRSAGEVRSMVQRRVEPFGRAYKSWLDVLGPA